jgi:hypothetical protein
MQVDSKGDDTDENRFSTAKAVFSNAEKPFRAQNIQLKQIEFMAKQATCCQAFRLKGIVLFLVGVLVSGLHIVIFVSVRKINLAYIFLGAAIACGLVPLYILFMWRRVMHNWIYKQLNEHKTRTPKRTNVNGRSRIDFFHDFSDINGKFYLLKMIASELVEDCYQVYMLKTIHMCTLPIAWTSLFSMVLVGEIMHRAYVHRNVLNRDSVRELFTVHERASLVMVDMVTDVFFLIIPIALYVYILRLSLTHKEVILMTAVPTMTLTLKVRELLVDIVQINAAEIIEQSRDTIARNMSRRRVSLFREKSFNVIVAQNQNEYFPRPLKRAAYTVSAIFSIVLLAIVVVQIASLGGMKSQCLTEHSKVVWDSCNTVVYFCRDVFKPSCNCAVMTIRPHNMTTLPAAFARLTSLRRLEISDGPLESVPKNMSKLQKLSRLIIDFSHLTAFDVDVSNMKGLVWLSVQYGRLKRVHASVWRLETLGTVSFNSNAGLAFPHDAHMPFLGYLAWQNNSVFIPKSLNVETFPRLRRIFVDGNRFEDVKGTFLGFNNMEFVGFSRCNLTAIPSAFNTMPTLVHMDARDNNITFVDPALKHILASPQVDGMFAGNPVCQVDASLDCMPRCSKYCWSERYLGNNMCDTTCDSKACNFDGGDCAAE